MACACPLQSGWTAVKFPARGSDLLNCGTGVERQRDVLMRSRYQDSLMRLRPERGSLMLQAEARALRPDAGNLAIMEDDGTLTSAVNLFDLRNRSILFVSGANGYRMTVQSAVFNPGSGTQVSLTDDDSRAFPLNPSFTFYGRSYDSVYLNSDGNLTFGSPDIASTARDLGRFAWGPPRIGPFFSDLDPAAGSMFYRRDTDGIMFVWQDVPAFGTAQNNSFSVKLFDNGNLEFVYGSRVDTPEAIVGISPGNDLDAISAVDFYTGLPADTFAGTMTEVFTPYTQLSETAIARKFYQNHPDEFDQLVVFLAFPFSLSGTAFAYELNVSNDVQGLGLEPMDDSSDYGSGGRLKSFVMMGSLGNFAANPEDNVLRTYNGLQVIAHEVAHRWLAFPFLREGGFSTMSLLHQADQAHWSFFFNADASLMEGNQIRDNGPTLGSQRFTTMDATNRFSDLDLYLMGFENASDVPPMFYVKNPTGTLRTSDSLPSRTATSFGGTRWDFTVNDIVAANGERAPSAFQSQKVHRIAFVLVTRAGQQVDDQIAKLQSYHDAFVPYFNQITRGQAWVVTTPQSSAGTTPSRIYFPAYEADATRYTGLALANWGSAPADILFRYFDNNGNLSLAPSTVINPRIITIPPGAQIAMTGDQIHALSPDGPARDGWILAESSSSQVTGFFLEGDGAETYLDGAVAGNRTSTWLCFTRAQGFGNRIEVVNPNDSAARVSLTLMKPDGTSQVPRLDRVINPHGRLADNLESLFSGTPPDFSGYVVLTSDVGVIGYESFGGTSTIYSLPAQAHSAATTLYSAQFASGPNGTIRYFTTLNLINTSSERRYLKIELIANDGTPAASPIQTWIDPGVQLLQRGESIFNLPGANLASALVEGTLVITADGPGIIGDVVFGDPSGGRFLAGLPLDGTPASEMVLAQVAEGSQETGKAYFTGIAMYNPNANDVTVTLDVYSEHAQPTGTQTIALASGKRVSTTLPYLVPAFNRQIRGYIRLRTTGGPIIAFELFGEAASLEFLAAVPAQPIQR